MIIRTFLLFVSLLASGILNAQELKVAANQKGKVGYKNSAGDIVIKQEYDYAEPFSDNGLAKVGKGDKYGLIDKSGKLVLPMDYSEIDPFAKDHATRIKKGKTNYGLINSQTGAVVLEPKYTYISKYNCYGLAWFTSGGKMVSNDGKQSIVSGKIGILDKNGAIVIAPNYKGLFEFSAKTEWGKRKIYGEAALLNAATCDLKDTLVTDCDYLGFGSNQYNSSESGVIDSKGNVLLEAKKYTWISKPVNGMIRFWKVKSKKEASYGYYDIANKKEYVCQTVSGNLYDLQYVTHGDFHGDIAPVNSTGSEGWYFVNKNVETISSGYNKGLKYSPPAKGEVGYYAGLKNDGAVVYDTNGTQYFADMTFNDAELPMAEYGNTKNFALNKDGKWGLYTINGKELIAPKYEYMFSSRYDIYFNKKGGKWGAVDVNDKQIIPTNYNDIIPPAEENVRSVWVQTPGDSLVYIYDIKAQKQYTTPYITVEAFKDGMAWAVPSTDGKTRVTDDPNKGYLVATDNNVLVNKAFSYKHVDEVRTAVKNNNGKALTSNEANILVLKLTRGEERYALDKLIPISGWDY